jgi:hypothetical protein
MARASTRSTPAQTPPQAPKTPAARQRIDEEHRQLGDLLHALARCHDPERALERLTALASLLREHFAHEEAADGLHALVGEGAAHRLPNLQRLFEEHREVLAAVASIEERLRNLVTGPWTTLRGEIHDLDATLRRHERDEDALFSEAFYIDIGGRSS